MTHMLVLDCKVKAWKKSVVPEAYAKFVFCPGQPVPDKKIEHTKNIEQTAVG